MHSEEIAVGVSKEVSELEGLNDNYPTGSEVVTGRESSKRNWIRSTGKNDRKLDWVDH